MQHQTYTTTEFNRYPDIFKFLSYFQFKNILSFGCSSGEECFSLKSYFRDSNIFGVDINQEALQQAINNADNQAINNVEGEARIVFSTFIDSVPQVDCIFAMSVFCRHPETSQVTQNNIYSFSNFNNEIIKLDNKLNIGGAFVVYNSNYYFIDTDVSKKYVSLNLNLKNEVVRKFDKTGKYSTVSSPIIFIKVSI